MSILEWLEQNWELMFLGLWLFGAWALTLPFPRSRPKIVEGFTHLNLHTAHGNYVRLDYRIDGTALEKALSNYPEARSIHARAEFFLLYCNDFHPERVLSDWYKSPLWFGDRRKRRDAQREAIDSTYKALKRRDLDPVFRPRPAPLERPLALSYPLLPTQFSLFVSNKFSYSHGVQKGQVARGFYDCEVLDWTAENSYAETIRLLDLEGNAVHLEQTTLMDAIRARKAAVESVNFLGMPIYTFTNRNRKLPPLHRRQRPGARLPVRPGTVRDYGALDKKLMKVFGGANPANFRRLSWFYHPVFGVKADETKYRRLVNKAEGRSSK